MTCKFVRISVVSMFLTIILFVTSCTKSAEDYVKLGIESSKELGGKEIDERTIRYFEKALELNPNLTEPLLSEVYWRMGQAYKNSDIDKEKGLQYLNKAIEVNPNCAEAYQWLAFEYYWNSGKDPERFLKGMEYYMKASELGSEDAKKTCSKWKINMKSYEELRYSKLSNLEKTQEFANKYLMAIEKMLEKDPEFDDFKNYDRLNIKIPNGYKILELRKDYISVIGNAGVIVNLYNKNSPNARISNSIKNNMILVEGGTFKMGNENGNDWEKPEHSVKINDFYISKYEITQGEYQNTIDTNPSWYKFINIDYPVTDITWDDAIEFCNKLSIKDGIEPYYILAKDSEVKINYESKGYRLPTEAEWEYAARGGNKSKSYKFSGSNKPNDVAWYNGNSKWKIKKVGEKNPNELGIYDMSGNVIEWCWDLFDSEYYKSSPNNNPFGASTNYGNRVLRGGNFESNDDTITCTFRTYSKHNNASRNGSSGVVGFRIAKSK